MEENWLPCIWLSTQEVALRFKKIADPCYNYRKVCSVFYNFTWHNMKKKKTLNNRHTCGINNIPAWPPGESRKWEEEEVKLVTSLLERGTSQSHVITWDYKGRAHAHRVNCTALENPRGHIAADRRTEQKWNTNDWGPNKVLHGFWLYSDETAKGSWISLPPGFLSRWPLASLKMQGKKHKTNWRDEF